MSTGTNLKIGHQTTPHHTTRNDVVAKVSNRIEEHLGVTIESLLIETFVAFLFGRCEGTTLRMFLDEFYFQAHQGDPCRWPMIYVTDDPRFSPSISLALGKKMLAIDVSGGNLELSTEKANQIHTIRQLKVVS